jgi:hypothetical protein
MEGAMKKLLLLALIAAAAWYGWHHWHALITKQPRHDLDVVNTASSPIVRLRVSVGGQTFVKESLAPGATASWQFLVQNDSDFTLVWEWGDKVGEQRWSGGRVVKGPIVQHHTLTIDGDNGVVYTFEDKHDEVSGSSS